MRMSGSDTEMKLPSSAILFLILWKFILIALYKYGDTYAPKPRGNSLPTKDNRTWVPDQDPVNMKRLEP